MSALANLSGQGSFPERPSYIQTYDSTEHSPGPTQRLSVISSMSESSKRSPTGAHRILRLPTPSSYRPTNDKANTQTNKLQSIASSTRAKTLAIIRFEVEAPFATTRLSHDGPSFRIFIGLLLSKWPTLMPHVAFSNLAQLYETLTATVEASWSCSHETHGEFHCHPREGGLP